MKALWSFEMWELLAEQHGIISQKAVPMCEPQISHLYNLFRGIITYCELVKAFGRSLSEWLRRFGWESCPIRPEYKLHVVQADVTRLLMVLSATQHTEFTKGVLYFMNIVEFYGTRVHVISFAPVIKSLPCPAHVFAKFTNAQRPSVPNYIAFHAAGTTDMASTCINSSTPWSLRRWTDFHKILAYFTDLFEELLSQSPKQFSRWC
jgi:hypothetical protein